MASGFQTAVGVTPAPGVEGSFSSANPLFMVVAGPGALVAGALGCTIARWGWLDDNAVDADGAPALVNNYGSGVPAGIIINEGQGLNTTFLSHATMNVPSGFMIDLLRGGDGFWVKNTGTARANVGDKCYANFSNGTSAFALAGATATAWGIAAASATFTGSIDGNVLTAGVVTGTLYPGSVLSGGTVASGTVVGDQITGVVGAAGQYYVSIGDQAVASAALTASYGLLTLTTVTAGTFGVGDTLTGATAGVTAGTRITSGPITGAGGSASTFAVNLTQTSGNGGQGDLTGALNADTGWVARSAGGAGELVKIGNMP